MTGVVPNDSGAGEERAGDRNEQAIGRNGRVPECFLV